MKAQKKFDEKRQNAAKKAHHSKSGKKMGKSKAKRRREARKAAFQNILKMLAWLAAIALMAGAALFLLPENSVDQHSSPVVIHRVMTSNPSICLSVEDQYYDWIELKNTGYADVDLSGWKLSDDVDLRGAFEFDSVVLPARETMIVYCDAAPAEYAGAEVFSGFRLSADGEDLALVSPDENHIDAVQVPAMGGGDIWQREESGEYRLISYFDLTRDDADYAPDLKPRYADNTLYISEIMPANRTTLPDGDGEYSDWVELYNGSSAPVSLKDYSLSDDDTNRLKWIFPDAVIQPGEYMVVFASGKNKTDASGRLHAGFRLSTSGEAVRLYDPQGNTLSYVEYGAADGDISLSRITGGNFTDTIMPSPGYENTAAGGRAALGTEYDMLSDNDLGLYINEVVCSDSNTGDWVELYNGSASAIDLSGMGLSDNAARPRKWQFPSGAYIPAGGYLAVRLSGAEGQSGKIGDFLYADFALSDGERITLSDTDGNIIDSILLFDQHRGISYGRAKNQARYRYFDSPTPMAANGSKSYEKRAAKVKFSVSGGLQQGSSINLELSAEEGMTIFYTTDGSDPRPSSNRYSGPIYIDKNTVVKAVAWRNDALQSETCAASYIFGERHGVRLVCISGKRSELNGSKGTLNTGIRNDGYDAYVEIYEPGGTQLISQKCKLTLAGHGSRTNYAQKGFSLKADQVYGDNLFRAALFEKRDYTEYKSLFMRASGQDAFQTHMRDSILTSLAEDTGVMYQETEVTVVYVNGEYWGVYNMRERVSAYSVCQFHGWENPDHVDLVEGSLDRMYAKQGSKEDLVDVIRWARIHDMTKDSNIEILRQRLDIENYLDYVALQIYTSNQDLNNMRAYRNAAADGKWRWIIYDLDLSYQIDANSISRWMKSGGVGSITQQDNTLFIRLMDNAKIRDYFLTRMGELLATTFSAENVTAKIYARYQILEPEMKKNCRRWDWSMDTWRRYGEDMMKYARTRPAKLIAYFQDEFHLNKQQMQKYFGAAAAKIG